VDLSDIVVSSKSQTPEEMSKVLTEMGFEAVEVEVKNADPAPAEEKPTEEPAADPEKVDDQPAADPVESEASESDDSADTEEETPSGDQPPAEKKLSKNAKRLKAARAREEALRAENEELKKKLATGTPATEVGKPASEAAAPATTPAEKEDIDTPLKKPTRAEFFDAEDPDEAYLDALADYRDNEKTRKGKIEQRDRQAEQTRSQQETVSREVQKEWEQQKTKARDRHEDFDQVFDDPTPLLSEAMNVALQSASDKAELAYWLGTHRDEAKRIMALTAIQPGESQSSVQKKLRAAYVEFDRIEKLITDSGVSANDDNDDDDADERVKPPVTPPAALPKSQGQPAPAASAAAAPPKKHTPITPVGASRVNAKKDIAKMSAGEIKKLSADEYRKLREQNS
jgi:hypothetical protein